MKVLHVGKHYYPERGGIELVTRVLCEEIARWPDFRATALVCHPKGVESEETIDGVRVLRASSLGLIASMPISLSLPYLYRRESRDADVIHYHMPFPLSAFLHCVLGNTRAKIIVHYHSDVIKQKNLLWTYLPFLRRLLDDADTVLVTSPAFVEHSSVLRDYAHKCEVLPLPLVIDEEHIPDPARVAELRASLGLKDTDRVVLGVGRLVYYKGFAYLVEAMRDIDAKLFIVGEGPLRHELEAQARELGVADKVTFVGEIDDATLQRYYALADIFAFPSIARSEAFGIVQMEAMHHGVPVVNTNLPSGVPWVSPHGKTGLTVPPEDPKALGAAINRLLEDRALWKACSAGGRERARFFEPRRLMAQLRSIYTKAKGVSSLPQSMPAPSPAASKRSPRSRGPSSQP